MSVPMVFYSNIQLSDNTALRIPAEIGEVTFIVGANGTGKSSLMQNLYIQNRGNSRRITAHRQNWLASNTVDFSPSQRLAQETSMSNQDTQSTSRWKDDYAAFRAGVTIYDLLDAENVRARGIAAHVTRKNIAEAQRLAEVSAPIAIINDLLTASNVPVEIFAERGDAIFARKNGGTPYSVAELSDGERNALLIGANILTAPQGTLILIDEPERHLHRSIISPFISLLFAHRSDCAFVVSTHDLGLPLDHPSAKSVLVRGCVFAGANVISWDVDILAPNQEIDDSLKADILGGRRKIVFVEGNEQSLDKPLYSILFPGVSVASKNSCKDVENHVSGIRDTAGFHWLKAFGIVDLDQLDATEVNKLQGKGIYALSVYSVEGLYYHPSLQELAAQRLASLTGDDALPWLAEAKSAAIAAIIPHVNRLAARMTESVVRNALMIHAPSWRVIQTSGPIGANIDVPVLLQAEIGRLNHLIQTDDLIGIVQRYPIRETPMIDHIVSKLHFKDRAQYEAAIRKLVAEEPAAKTLMLGFFGQLPQDLQAA